MKNIYLWCPPSPMAERNGWYPFWRIKRQNPAGKRCAVHFEADDPYAADGRVRVINLSGLEGGTVQRAFFRALLPVSDPSSPQGDRRGASGLYSPVSLDDLYPGGPGAQISAARPGDFTDRAE